MRGNGTIYSIEKIIIHENYGNPFYAHDIALLLVTGTIEFNENVQPIELSPDEVPEDSVAQLTGWGYLDVRKVEICNFFQSIQLFVIVILRFIYSIDFRK